MTGTRFNRSLYEKASLRIAVERLNGHRFTSEQIHEGIDLEAFVGRHFNILVVHNETSERTYANIVMCSCHTTDSVAKWRPLSIYKVFERNLVRLSRIVSFYIN